MVTNFFANPQASGADALLDRLRVATAGLYDVAGEIGRGGMAVVYIATDMRLGRKVAIKVMEPRLSFTPGMAERFLQEARIAARLQHHNIIVVHEVQQDEELIFFVMRLVEGGSLDEIYRRLAQRGERLPLDQAKWILWQSARALSYAHSEGIVHRDVKPANILVTTKGEVVVTDFGIAKAADGEGLTKSGMAIGTPIYMSPEQFTGNDPVSGAADQYALGVAAYELLTGAPPFTGDLYRLIAAHGNTAPLDLRESRPECPAPLAEAVMRMLEKRPADRWPSLDAILPVLGEGLSIDGSSTRSDLALVASDLQAARAASVAAWGAVAPNTPAWTSGSRRRTGPVPTKMSISPPNGQVVAGGRLDLRAVVVGDTGSTISDASVTWTSSDPAVASVSADGVVVGVSPGEVTVRASVSGGGNTNVVQAVAEVHVTARQAARVRIVQGEQSMECGEALLLSAEVTDARNVPLPSAEVQWSSSRPEVLHVDERGTIMALAGGMATVTARVGGVHGTVRIEVREAPVGAVELVLAAGEADEGVAVPVSLTVTDISGLPRSSAGLAVICQPSDAAEVESDPLAVVGRVPGRVRVEVVSSGNQGSSSVREPWATAVLLVRPVVASVELSVPTATLTVGDELVAVAEVLDARGAPVAGAAREWQTSDTRVADVDGSGRVRAVSPGTARVRVTSGGKTAERSVAVRAVPVAALQVSSEGSELVVGVPLACAVQATDVRGNVAAAEVRWSVRPAGAATVSERGVVVASAAGEFTVVATANTETGGRPIEGTLALRARAARVTAVRLLAPKRTLRVGERMRCGAESVVEGGGVSDSVAPVWSIDDELVARITPDGEVEALGVGSVSATVRVGEVSESVALTVAAARSPVVWWGGGVGVVAAVALVAALALRNDAAPGSSSDATSLAAADSVAAAGGVSVAGDGGSPAGNLPGDAAPTPGTPTPGSPNSEADAVPAAVAPPERQPDPPARGVAAGENTKAIEPRPPAARTPAAQRPTRATPPPADPVSTTAAPPPPVVRVDTAPPVRTEVAGPSNEEMRSLAAEYVGRLNGGEFRTGELASFFSRTSSGHKATMVGQPRAAGRQGDALLVDVDLQVERTLGSGALDRRTGTVRLTLRGRSGAAVIESAIPGALTRAR